MNRFLFTHYKLYCYNRHLKESNLKNFERFMLEKIIINK